MNIYNYHPETKEYLSTSIAESSPLEENVYLIPANATNISVISRTENTIQIFNETTKEWILKSDLRNKDIYDKKTGEKLWASIGDTLESLDATDIKPDVEYPKWNENNKTWETNSSEKLLSMKSKAGAQINNLLNMASNKILPLQDAVDLDIATEEEKKALSVWKNYRVLINRIPAQTGYPTQIDWPLMPE